MLPWPAESTKRSRSGQCRVGGIVLQMPRPQSEGHGGGAHGQAGMAGVGLLHRVRREEADGVDAALLERLRAAGLCHGASPRLLGHARRAERSPAAAGLRTAAGCGLQLYRTLTLRGEPRHGRLPRWRTGPATVRWTPRPGCGHNRLRTPAEGEDAVHVDIYEKLAEALDRLPTRFPRTPTDVELPMLRKLYTPEQARLAAAMGRDYETVAAIAARAGVAEADGRRDPPGRWPRTAWRSDGRLRTPAPTPARRRCPAPGRSTACRASSPERTRA